MAKRYKIEFTPKGETAAAFKGHEEENVRLAEQTALFVCAVNASSAAQNRRDYYRLSDLIEQIEGLTIESNSIDGLIEDDLNDLDKGWKMSQGDRRPHIWRKLRRLWEQIDKECRVVEQG